MTTNRVKAGGVFWLQADSIQELYEIIAHAKEAGLTVRPLENLRELREPDLEQFEATFHFGRLP